MKRGVEPGFLSDRVETTGIGSLPHRSVEEAVAASFRLDIPFLPHLPALSSREFMLEQALTGGALATEAFFSRLSNDPRPKVKFQIAGPCTLEHYVPGLSPAQARARIEAGLIPLLRRARKSRAEPLVFLDEPALAVMNPDDSHWVRLGELVRSLIQEGATVGLHCCGEADWTRALELPIRVLSFDASLSLPSILTREASLLEFSGRNGRMAPGILEVKRERSTDDLARTLRQVASHPAFRDALLTPACGLALLNEESADQLMNELVGISRRFASERS